MLSPLTTRYLWAEINIMATRCRHEFGLPRIKPHGWQRYQGIVSVRYFSAQPKCKRRIVR